MITYYIKFVIIFKTEGLAFWISIALYCMLRCTMDKIYVAY